MRTSFPFFVAVAILPLLAPASEFQFFEGRVISVADGDTLTVLLQDKSRLKVRLRDIDAPEAGQPYGNRSKQALSEIVFGKHVKIIADGKDGFGRWLGIVLVHEINVNEEMVKQGAAWVYREYVDGGTLYYFEAQAKDAERGLWGITEAKSTPPWEWRRTGGQEEAPLDCFIKGNIGSGGARIYHVPGMSSYGRTKIDLTKGERWFCSEEEAMEAGWRAPRGR